MNDTVQQFGNEESYHARSAERHQMVADQIKRRGITDKRVLDAFAKVPRHKFVPKHLQRYAYEDSPLPVGHGQTISQPFIVALSTTLAEVGPHDRVLDVGTGSGYQAAILSELADQIYSVDIVPEFTDAARKNFSDLDIDNVEFAARDGYAGWPEVASFDAIIVAAAPKEIPAALKEQLKVGGKLVIPVGEQHSSQTLKVISKIDDDTFEERDIVGVRFVPLKKERSQA